MIDPRHRRRVAGFAAVAFFLVMLVVTAAEDPSIAAAQFREPVSLHVFGEVVSRIGLSGYMLTISAATAVVASLVLRRSERPDRRRRARLLAERGLFVFAAVAGSGLACQTIKHLVGRARPRFFPEWGAFHFTGPNLRAGVDSFPSGHSTSVFAAAVALSLIVPAWRAPLFALAVLVCLARVLAGAHYPSDTAAGAVLGSVVTIWLARSFATRGLAFPVPGTPWRPDRPSRIPPERTAP